MAVTSSSRNNHNHNNQQRSLSPSGRFCSSSISSSSFTTRSTSLFNRLSSNGYNNSTSSSPSPSIRFAIGNRTTSPNRSISVNPRHLFTGAGTSKKKTCTCSPTTHPGSFRCNFHRNLDAKRQYQNQSVSYSPNRLNMRRSAMSNSLVRIGSVEGGDMVKRALATLIRPSSHQQKRRCDFQSRPSRLSSMTLATEEDNRR